MVVRTLSGGSTEMPKNWNRRFKHNRDKMKTGNIFELAEVVRNLSVRNNEKGLSTGEKQMFVKAKKILASELMYAKARRGEAAEWLDGVLSRAGREGEARRSRRRPREGQAAARGEGVRSVSERLRRRSVPGRFSSRPGAGERLGVDRPKAFAALGGRPLLAESLERLDRSPWVDAIVVAAPAGLGGAAILLAEELAASKVVVVRDGRRDASRFGARCARRGARRGARRARARRRAAVRRRRRCVDRVLGAAGRGLRRGRARAPAGGHGQARRARASSRPARDDLVAHRRRRHSSAPSLRRALAGDLAGSTDCASLVERPAGGSRVVEGDPRLLKVTTPADLELVEALSRPLGQVACAHVAHIVALPVPGTVRAMALKAVFFDVGETLVDEERWWRVLSERPASSRTSCGRHSA